MKLGGGEERPVPHTPCDTANAPVTGIGWIGYTRDRGTGSRCPQAAEEATMTQDDGTGGRELGPRSSFTTEYIESGMPAARCGPPLPGGTHLPRLQPAGGAR